MSQKRQIFKLNILKKLLTDENSCVSLMQSTRLLALPPFFLTDMKSGILYLLNSMLKKYDRSLGGIVIGYQNIKVLMDENTGIIPIGTSEMEVNISVEFYIFQPKIGSYLEGIINKKSNNHIGCLVHQYFNATILKPEDVLYEDWICKDFNVDDKIIFKVIDLDFTTLLPYIEGIYDGRLSLDKVESKSSGNCDIDSTVANNVIKNCKNEVSFSKEFLKGTTNSDEISDNDFLDVKKGKNKCKSEVNIENVGSSLDESRPFTGTQVKRKKEKKEKFPVSDVDIVKGSEEKGSSRKEVNVDKIDGTLPDEEKKKRKKRKRNKDESNEQECLTEVENVEKNSENSSILPSHVQEKLLQVEDENSNDFVKFSKSKKEKKKKFQNEEPVPSLNKTNECLPSEEVEDSILYSTQLEPVLGSKKMRISFCSPIPQSAPFEDKSTTSSVYVNNQDNLDATPREAKKKHKKRKREKLESEDSPAQKKIKISNTSSSKKVETKSEEVDSGEKKSIVQIMMEQLCQEQLNRVKEELNMSSSDKEEKKKKEKKKKKGKGEKEHSEKSEEKEKSQSVGVSNAKSQLNGEDGKSELQSTLNELFRRELQKVKEQLSVSSKESFKEKKKKKVKVKKEEKEERVVEESPKVKESESVNEKKSDIKTLVEELCKQQLDRIKEELSVSHTGHIKEKKKKKSATVNQESSREGTHDSLYDKLLNEAKSAVDMEKIAAPIVPPAAESGKKKKDGELSDMSVSSSKKKKSKHSKQRIEDCHQLPAKYKNGNMYDVVATPEKLNPDKSLFSDSEQSHASPVKKRKEVNGVESGKSKVQNMLDEFYKEEIKRLKSESDRESSTGKDSKKKSPNEEKPQIPSGKEESLYEKLLKQAKSLVDVRDASVPPKKEKKAKKSKKSGEGFC